MVDSESATLDGWDQIGLDVAHPGLSKFRGPKDANYETVVEAILKIVNDTNDRPWFGGAADCQPRHELGGQISPSKEHQDRSIQQLSQTCGLDKSVTEPFANMVTGKSTGLGLPREETSVSTSTTSHSHGTTATQTSTIPPGPVYHEPYRRVPILSDDESSTSSATPGESPTVKNLRNTFMGFSLVAVGAIGDSCLRDELHGTLSTRGCNSQALLGEGTPCTAEKADIGRYPASDTFSCLSGGLDHQLKPHMPKGRLTTVTHPQHWAPLATESSSTVIITDTAAYEEPDDYYREATTMGDANPNHAGMVENVALGKLRALNGR